jgi:hypothetical protein
MEVFMGVKSTFPWPTRAIPGIVALLWILANR